MNNYRRYNPLLDEWIIVAANRIRRPWSGADGRAEKIGQRNEGVGNSLAPGGVRSSGKVNDNYTSTYVFDNGFPSFTELDESPETENDDLFKQMEIRGVCRVICYHPDSDLTLATMKIEDVRTVVDVWNRQFSELAAKYEWIQIFENRGEVVGCSNMHPHGQLWASNYLPTIPQKKFDTQKKYFEKHGTPLLIDYQNKELARKSRIVAENATWIALVPYWAVWPYETMILPKRRIQRFVELSDDKKNGIAEMLQTILIKYDNIFECSFPYMMGWFGAPTGRYLEENCEFWQLHLCIYPPLLRSAHIPKFIAGYEVFAEKQRDILPEDAAEKLRKMSDVHYSKMKK
ncbi:unnamed protein product [Caenorhabditis bovis]|uniref:Galactose-1-phosphate uridylyltransferase n=1 Tax=Caenorhabditis bovis TaxID=2654633 RepID=A0A8S1ER43_9PELO|nr:unnamed protein product [Caenorhabditis bovis]